MNIYHNRLRRDRAARKLREAIEYRRVIETTIDNIAGTVIHVNNAVNSWAGFTSVIKTEIIRLRREVRRG